MFLRGGVWPILSSLISAFSSATGKVKNEHDQGDDKQDMNESTSDVKRKSTGPKKHEKNGDDEKHA